MVKLTSLMSPLDSIASVSYYWPQRSCGQGNVLTGVCLSTGGRVSASVHAGMPYLLDGEPPQWRTPLSPDGEPHRWRTPLDGEPPGMENPPGSRLQYTVDGQPVRILLECILVIDI